MTILIRSVQRQSEIVGRTLEGIAFEWDRPSEVSDGGPSYLEAFARGAANKTISDHARGGFPVGILHPWSDPALGNGIGRTSPIPLGRVDFEDSAEGLIFRTTISKTQAGDEALELVNDGALGDVSVGYRAFRSERRGNVVVRREIGIKELSLAPIGWGQHAGAQVLAVRSNTNTATPRREELSRFLATLRPIT